MKNIPVGEVAVHIGNPPDNNPYKGGGGLMGPERKKAFDLWWAGEDVSKYTFWLAPATGGARKLTPKDTIRKW